MANDASTIQSRSPLANVKKSLPREIQLRILEQMIKARVIEERLIKLYKLGESYFWLGGPGEEAFGVPLGFQINKGQGIDHDFLHFHYRATPTLIAMGLEYLDAIRLTINRATDRSTGGRNFGNHFCIPEWNVVPITSILEVQYGHAVGSALIQKQKKAKGVSIVTGGDAGTAEGDFASCLIWASRPGNELPLYITVQNNKWGISTPYETQHGEKHIADRGKAFGIRTRVVDGNDPIECYFAIQEDLEYIRRTGRPVLAEYMVSRLYGHSSASGANRMDDLCAIEGYERKIVDQGFAKMGDIKALWSKYEEEAKQAAEVARLEPGPGGDTIWNHVYKDNENADWRKF